MENSLDDIMDQTLMLLGDNLTKEVNGSRTDPLLMVSTLINLSYFVKSVRDSLELEFRKQRINKEKKEEVQWIIKTNLFLAIIITKMRIQGELEGGDQMVLYQSHLHHLLATRIDATTDQIIQILSKQKPQFR